MPSSALAHRSMRGSRPSFPGRSSGIGKRLEAFPVREPAERRILREQVQEVRGTRPWKAADDDRPVDLLVLDFRVQPVELLQPQSAPQQLQHELARGNASERRELRLALHRAEQNLHGLAKAIVAEVGQPRLLAGGREQVLRLERNECSRRPSAHRVEEAKQEGQARIIPVRDSGGGGRGHRVPRYSRPRGPRQSFRGVDGLALGAHFSRQSFTVRFAAHTRPGSWT